MIKRAQQVRRLDSELIKELSEKPRLIPSRACKFPVAYLARRRGLHLTPKGLLRVELIRYRPQRKVCDGAQRKSLLEIGCFRFSPIPAGWLGQRRRLSARKQDC